MDAAQQSTAASAPPHSGEAASPFHDALADYREATREITLVRAEADADEELLVAQREAEAAQARLNRLKAAYAERQHEAGARAKTAKQRMVDAWPDATRKTLRGDDWTVQRRDRHDVVVHDDAQAAQLLPASVLSLALKRIEWDQATLRNVVSLRILSDATTPGGRPLFDTRVTTSLAIKLATQNDDADDAPDGEDA